MARLWSSGFECNSLTVGIEFKNVGNTGSTSPSIVTSPVNGGTYAYHVSNSGSAGFARVNNLIATSDVNGPIYMRTAFRVHVAPSAQVVIFMLSNSSEANVRETLRLNTDLTLSLYDGAGTLIGSASPALSLDTWYYLEMKYYNNTGSGYAELEGRVNGNSFTSTTTSPATGGAGMLYIGTGTSITTFDFYWDNVAVNDNTGSYQNSYPGYGIIKHLRPNATGDSNQFTTQIGGTAGSSNNYTRVKEVTEDGASSYNGDTTVNHTDMYKCDASGIGANDIVNVVNVLSFYAGGNTSSVATMKMQIEKAASGTIYQSPGITATSGTFKQTTAANSITEYLNPDGTIWTQSILDTMQIGMKVNTGNTYLIGVSNIYALIDYTPTTTQTIIGKSNIFASTLQTILGLSRVTVSTLQTILGKSKLNITTTKALQGLSRITISTAQTILGVSRITILTTQLRLGLSRITSSTTKTILGLDRITISTSQAILGKGDLFLTHWPTIFGKSRITISTSKTIHGRLEIFAHTPKTLLGKSSILRTQARIILGNARITIDTLQTILGKSRIGLITTKIILGLARITAWVSKTILAKSSVLVNTSKTILGKSRITVSTVKTLTGISRVTHKTIKNIQGIGRIGWISLTTILGKSRIKITTTNILLGLGRIGLITKQTILGKARVLASAGKTIAGRSKIQFITKTALLGHTRLMVTTSKILLGVSRITIKTTHILTGVSRVTIQSAKTIIGKCDISSLTSRSIMGIARIRRTVYKVITGISRVTVVTRNVLLGHGSIRITTSKSLVGSSLIIIPFTPVPKREPTVLMSFTT